MKVNTKNKKIVHVIKTPDFKYNFKDEDGNYIFDRWFDSYYGFYGEYAKISLKDKGYNFIDRFGNFIFDVWQSDHYYYSSDKFYNGYTKIYDGEKGYNLINIKGEYLSNEWFFTIDEFSEDFSVVTQITDDGIEYIKLRYSNTQTLEEINNLDKAIASEVMCNFMDTNGKLLSNIWFSNAYNFQGGFAPVKLNDKWNYINKTGEYYLMSGLRI